MKNNTDIPCLSIAYDGAEATASEIQLEAFIHQAKEYSRLVMRDERPIQRQATRDK
ncbi:MAG: hypothetical protein HZC12_00635 [Nitrospirae bacterium]|nr:hypothetical protein [Nitrospirota bacterium]